MEGTFCLPQNAENEDNNYINNAFSQLRIRVFTFGRKI